MASDILIVDDEEDIRELVAGILSDEGHETRTAHDADSALAAIADRVPRLVFLDIWLQGSRLDGLALLDQIKTMHPEPAGGDDLGPRQHRDRRFRDPPRRLRFHREAVQGRPPDPDRRARAGDVEAQARGLRPQAAQRRDLRPDRHVVGDEPVAADHRACRADQQPHHDHRPVRLGQGACGARHPRAVVAQGRSVRHRQFGHDHAGAHGDRAVRHRIERRRAQGRRAGGGASRHPLSRRGRRHAARDAEQDPARARRPAVRAGRGHQAGQGRRAHHLLDRAEPRRA